MHRSTGLSRFRGVASTAACLMLVLVACGPTSPQPVPTTPPNAQAAAGAATAVPTLPALAATASVPGVSTAAAPASTAAQPATAAVKGGTLRVATLQGLPTVLHPYPESQNNTVPRAQAQTLMFANLIDIDYDTLDWVADPRRSLAKDLPRVSSDARTYTFTLRDNIRWSDGKPITAQDFQFAWDNASKKENNFVGLGTLDRIDSFTSPDAQTIEVTLKQPLARFLALSTIQTIIPLPRQVWEGKPWLDTAGNPEILKPSVVSGPYLVKELTAQQLTYTRNPLYWGQQPNIDQIVFTGAAPTTVIELLKTQQVEWAQEFPPASYDDATHLPNANVVSWSGATGTYRTAEFNTARAPLSDKRVREALVRALNRADLIQFEDGLAVPQYGIYTQGNKWRNDSVERYDFDLARSRQLLQDAGMKLDGGVLKDASGNPVKLDLLWPTSSAPRGKVATYIQQQWKQLGIDTTVTGLEFNAFVDKQSRQKDFDVAIGTWSAQLDPDSVKSNIQTGGTQNSVGYSNTRVDLLIEQGAIEQDETRRKQIYDEIQQIVADDLPIYYMTTLKNFTAFDKKVRGVVALKGGDILRQNNLQILDWYLQN